MEWKPDKILALRKKLSLNQREFAKQLGVKRQTLACWESGYCHLRFRHAC